MKFKEYVLNEMAIEVKDGNKVVSPKGAKNLGGLEKFQRDLIIKAHLTIKNDNKDPKFIEQVFDEENPDGTPKDFIVADHQNDSNSNEIKVRARGFNYYYTCTMNGDKMTCTKKEADTSPKKKNPIIGK